jgi:hypothetical protein
VAECATILIACAAFGLAPIRHVRHVLVARAAPRADILRVSLPQIQRTSYWRWHPDAVVGGRAGRAGMLAAGIKVVGGFTTLVGSAALDSFRRLARLGSPADAPRSGPADMVTVLSWRRSR